MTAARSASRQPPGPKGSVVLGSLPELDALGPLQFWAHLWRRHGDFAAARFGPIRAVMVVHPRHLEEVLVRRAQVLRKGLGYRDLRNLLGNGLITVEDPPWRRHRSALQSAFTPAGVLGFDGVLTSAAEKLVDRWRHLARSGTTVELSGELVSFAMGTASRAIFGVDLQAHRLDVAEAFDDCFSFMANKTSNPFSAPLILPTRANLAFRRNRRLINRFIGELMDRSGVLDRPNWVLERFIQSTADGNAATDRRQIRDEIISLFFAGYETSARALTWSLLLLMQNPAVAAGLKSEVNSVMGADGRPQDNVDRLVFTAAVVRESLRLYPPAPMFARQNSRPIELDGMRIPPGTLIVCCPYLTHRHPDFWSEPDSFRPDRFLGGGEAERSRSAYLPFGTGPRNCIGQFLAMRELVITLAEIARGVEIARIDNSPVVPHFNGTLKPASDILVSFRECVH